MLVMPYTDFLTAARFSQAQRLCCLVLVINFRTYITWSKIYHHTSDLLVHYLVK